MKEIVVFDLDGTLLSGDSAKAWLTDKLKSNIFRFIAALIVTPIALPLMKFKKYKSKGASLYLWIATYSLNEEELEYSFKNFSKNINETTSSSLYWFKQGIAEVKDHLANGRIVFIATAAPEKLASILLESTKLDVRIIGTPLQNKLGGWVSGTHCRAEEKVKRLNKLDIKQPWFATYSDDIDDDLPILIGAKLPYLINGDNNKIKNIKIKNLKILNWI
ncbi:TPA: haloacid dehalogenase-like hydrolase [Acinetobacter baumannii]|jgi:phosphatidylglycerophosphatase C|uniref:Haloacid dehalogenase n=1 Tax=Acinetobacter baumannii EGD-HP18 TaxID=1358412 RepID=A0AAV3K5F4_ACIBA|nr:MULTISPECIES: haloacid dehalogenase-like hydrolase [Acinetobacter]ERH73125.1 haloacid dehalogenase [Acinetobacter baumannii EGD-HP18]MBJ9386855.1 haloacid dehalogenase-like hydrolase [Acinetobacter baumannii]MBJ9430995.1 haloacid dehalogenase-like hydrolase [Acinetobacter baumannii]MCE6409364.1 haloacid dehalogenase-like hydrolase [Acinetobacter baumannii]MCT9373042.1 haloacid dehalogenase-like hydrolase [Acinetobacter baumannii]